MTDLAACETCGWSCRKVWRFSNNDCEPDRGRIVRELMERIRRLPHVTAEQSGYGFGYFAITIGDDADGGRHVTLVCDVDDHGRIGVNQTFWSRRDSPPAIQRLINALALFHEMTKEAP